MERPLVHPKPFADFEVRFAQQRELVADGFGYPIPKGFIYGAMAFSLLIEMLNIRMRKAAAKPVDLHEKYEPAGTARCPECGAPSAASTALES